jgi:hypothetical protein
MASIFQAGESYACAITHNENSVEGSLFNKSYPMSSPTQNLLFNEVSSIKYQSIID